MTLSERTARTLYCAHDRHDDCDGRVGIVGRRTRPHCACECHAAGRIQEAAAVARDPAAIRAAVDDADRRGIAVSPYLRRAATRGMIARTLR